MKRLWYQLENNHETVKCFENASFLASDTRRELHHWLLLSWSCDENYTGEIYLNDDDDILPYLADVRNMCKERIEHFIADLQKRIDMLSNPIQQIEEIK